MIIGYAKTPPGWVYLGTGHYYLDYFQYLEAISQGMRGHWLYIKNYTATDVPIKTFFGKWQYLLIGKLGGIFHLSPSISYWLSVLFFSVIFSLLIFKFISRVLPKLSFYHKLMAFLLSLFAAPFFRLTSVVNGLDFQIYEIWSDRSVLFRRFGSIPYHISYEILVLVVLLIVSDTLKKLSQLTTKLLLLRILIVVLLMFFLLTFAPAVVVLLMVSLSLIGGVLFFISLILKKKDRLKLLILFGTILIIMIPAAILVKNYLAIKLYPEVIQAEKFWQPQLTVWRFVLMSGPIFVIGLFGIVNYLRELTPARLVLLVYVLVSHLIFFSPLPVYLGTTNTRFLTPISYILYGCLVVLAVRKLRRLAVVSIVSLILFLPGNIVSLKTMINDQNLNSPISYLPKGIMRGFKYLDSIPDKKAVLTTPAQFLGAIVPIYTGKPVYMSRPGQDYNYYPKSELSARFYTGGMTVEEAREFLKKNRIGYVITTSIEGYYQPKTLQDNPLLKEIYKNNDVVIFKSLVN